MNNNLNKIVNIFIYSILFEKQFLYYKYYECVNSVLYFPLNFIRAVLIVSAIKFKLSLSWVTLYCHTVQTNYNTLL